MKDKTPKNLIIAGLLFLVATVGLYYLGTAVLGNFGGFAGASLQLLFIIVILAIPFFVLKSVSKNSKKNHPSEPEMKLTDIPKDQDEWLDKNKE